ncbi:MAG: hypothetical protein FWE61_05930, partial [Micrococcales bacterium]|nr:hypothetical protein [Micrococcales bacterium]
MARAGGGAAPTGAPAPAAVIPRRGARRSLQWTTLFLAVVVGLAGVVGVVQSSRAETLTNGGWSIGSHFSTLDQTWTVYAYALAGETVTFTTVVGEQSSSAG